MSDRCPNSSTYSKGCRCSYCRAVVARYARDLRRRKAEAVWGKVHPNDSMDPGPTVAAVHYARHELGITYREIARVTGLTTQTIEDLYFNRRIRVLRDTQDRVLRVYGPKGTEDRALDNKQFVDFRPHAWKLYGLFAQGWTKDSLAKVLQGHGYSSGWMSHVNSRNQVTYSTIKALDWLVNHIGDRSGPSFNNQGRMAARGIFPLIHYTEEGKLIRGSLRPEQLEIYRRVRSQHGPTTSRARRAKSRTGLRRGRGTRAKAS